MKDSRIQWNVNVGLENLYNLNLFKTLNLFQKHQSCFLKPFNISLMKDVHWTVIRKISQNTGFLRTTYSLIRIESSIPSLYGNIQVGDNPYSYIFNAVQ